MRQPSPRPVGRSPRRSLQGLALGLGAILGLAALGPRALTGATSAEARDAAHGARSAGRPAALVDPAVELALGARERVDVIVALEAGPRPATGASDAGHSLASDAPTVDRLQTAVLAALPADGFTASHRYRNAPVLAGSVSADGLAALAADPAVAAVSLDPIGRTLLDKSVPFIGADKVWRQGYDGEGVRVAVMDTGVNATGLDLRDAVVVEKCMVDPPSLCPAAPHEADDAQGHGTAVAGIVASRGKRAPKGVAPKAEIIAVKLMERRDDTFPGSVLLAALDWAADRDDIDVINLSVGSGAYEGDCDRADAYTRGLAALVATLRARSVSVVAASGNDGQVNKMSAPACLAGVLSVGAVDGYDTGSPKFAADFSNRSESLDLLAPGTNVETVGLKGEVNTGFRGTSAAAPHVAGAVALLRQAAPWAGPDVLQDVLVRTGGLPFYRYGSLSIPTIRVDAALRELRDMTPPATSPATATNRPTTASPTNVPATATWTATSTDAAPSPSAGPSATASPSASAVPSVTASRAPSATSTTAPTGPGPIYLPVARRL